jgi:hypothetical protein
VTLYILNESKSIDGLGPLDIFSTLELLIEHIEAIDVRNDEYFAFTSEGNRIFLSASSDYSPIKYTLDELSKNKSDLKKLLVDFLNDRALDPRFNLNLADVKLASYSLRSLVKLIPETFVHRK